MRRVLLIPLLIAPALALAQVDQHRCIVSFDSARLDTCTGQVELQTKGLAALADVDAFKDSTLRIVKFDGPIREEQRVALLATGAEIIGYAPYHAYLVRMAPTLDSAARAIGGVTWTGPYLPIWKVDINLANDIGGMSIVEEGGIEQLNVSLRPGSQRSAAQDALSAVGGLDFRFHESGADHDRLVYGFDQDSLGDIVDRIARLDEVMTVTLRWPAEFMNSQAGWLHQSGSNNQLPVFEQGLFGCGQVIGAADSGLHATHCSFSDTAYGQPVTSVCASGGTCTAGTPDFAHRKIGIHYKWSGDSGTAPADGHGHGTHVMGSIAGNNPADAVDCSTFSSPGGTTDLDGTAPGAKLISQEMGASLQYLNSLGGNPYHAGSIAYAGGARIHSNSWGSSCRNALGICIAGCQVEYRSTSRDADLLVWDNPDLAVLFAAGNSGGGSGTSAGSAGCGPGADTGAAGNAKNVFSIGSNNRGASGNAMSGFSSRGPTQDRRTKPDLTAQGGSIISASRTACGTTGMSGTSMATPTAAGLTALVREYLNRGFYPTGMANAGNAMPTPSSALLKAIMITGAQTITGSGTGTTAPSTAQGWGRINLDNVLYFTGDSRNLWLHDGTTGLTTGGLQTHTLTVTGTEPLTVTLAWHDFPALVNANPASVNQLRLEVVAPNGDVWTQKLPAGGGLTSPNPLQDTGTSNYDDTNNVHRILLPTPTVGAYQVRVRGIQVAQGGSQPYALAATGNINVTVDPDYMLTATPAAVSICAGAPASYGIGALGIGGFNDPVTLSVTGLPGSATSSFSTNPVVPALPAATSTLGIGNTASASAGSYTLTVTGNSSGPGFPATSRSTEVSLVVASGAPAAGTLVAPANNATNVATQPTLSWNAIAGAESYRVEVATDAAFSNVVIDEVVATTSYAVTSPLSTSADHFWRVTGTNSCGTGTVSTVFTFRTLTAPGDCAADQTAVALLDEDFSAGLGAFATTGSTGASTWSIAAAPPAGSPSGGNAVFAADIASVSDQRLISPAVTLPSDQLPLSLQFWNRQQMESATTGCFDAGLLEISSNGGSTWTQVTGPAILNRAYDGAISTQYSNPLGGMNAWCGNPRDWENYIIDLNAWAGQTVQFRWRVGTDTSVAATGWHVDDIKVQACETEVKDDTIFANGFEAPL